jgi:hypothetical protein
MKSLLMDFQAVYNLLLSHTMLQYLKFNNVLAQKQVSMLIGEIS